jgi:D-arginine dehydrogenase
MNLLDFVVVGGGIAGASIAAELSGTHKVMILEMEDQPGYHASGRSAALYSENYGNAAVRALTRASKPFYDAPPAGFCDTPLLAPRGILFVANAEQMEEFAAFAADPDVQETMEEVDPERAFALCPALRRDYVVAAIYSERAALDIETAALHQGYLRQFKHNGGELKTRCQVERLERLSDGWAIHAGGERFEARVIVNAAGAWADQIAVLAGLPPIGIQPFRRTAILVDAPAYDGVEHWPAVGDISESFYFKPDAGLIMLSPGDETPDAAGDAQADEWDIAVAIDRVTTAADIPIRTIRHRWAGLRSFAPDRTPVAGYDNGDDHFFWLAGQGGYGFQTGPALARVAACLAIGLPIPAEIAAEGVDAASLSPARFGLRQPA